MKIIQPNNTKKITIIAAAIILFMMAATGYAYYKKSGPFAVESNESVNLEKPTQEQLDAGMQAKEQSINQTNKKTTSGSDPARDPQPIEGSDKKSVHAEITAANQNDSTLQVRTLIQTITSTGTCTLSMKGPQGKIYTSTVDVQPLASSTTCKGYDIPLDQLASGVWTIAIDFSNDELTASASKEITVK